MQPRQIPEILQGISTGSSEHRFAWDGDPSCRATTRIEEGETANRSHHRGLDKMVMDSNDSLMPIAPSKTTFLRDSFGSQCTGGFYLKMDRTIVLFTL
jgi:hypothetical protein